MRVTNAFSLPPAAMIFFSRGHYLPRSCLLRHFFCARSSVTLQYKLGCGDHEGRTHALDARVYRALAAPGRNKSIHSTYLHNGAFENFIMKWKRSEVTVAVWWCHPTALSDQ